jgi:methionine-rich copper-binding protein CopC
MSFVRTTILALAIASPITAFAHATPISMEPVSSSAIEKAPSNISIRFSERLDAGASDITVKDTLGKKISGAVTIDPNDPRTLHTTIEHQPLGLYNVTWSVVSSDDGHFTKGSYAFVVGSGTVPITAPTEEMVQIATKPEALAMTVELFGNGLLWALLILFAFVFRRVISLYEKHAGLFYFWQSALTLFAWTCVCTGALAQILLKSSDLAALRETSLLPAIALYITTAAGSATIYRFAAATIAVCIFFICRRKIRASATITLYEIALALALCVFAYYRAIISHATANSFLPDLSVAVNFLHVIEKDFFAGALAILFLLALHPKLCTLLTDALPTSFRILAVNIAILSATGCYIIWLHLKTFSNIFTTQWGASFLQLFCAVLLLISVRTFAVWSRAFTPRTFGKTVGVVLGIEFALALLVLFFSSVVIITSPPVQTLHTPVFSANENGLSITLEKDRSNDTNLLVKLSKATGTIPSIGKQDPSQTEPDHIDVTQTSARSYSFPILLLGAHETRLTITVPQKDAYDAHASFVIRPQDFTPDPATAPTREVDFFTLVFVALALSALVFGAVLYHYSIRPEPLPPQLKNIQLVAIAACIMALCIVGGSAASLSQSRFANPFKAQCIRDGNMWHLMLPTKAGIAQSHTPTEGCMWGMGKYVYQFIDQDEYEFNSTLPETSVDLTYTPQKIVAGKPTRITAAIKNSDGSPATLFMDMEKIAHMVIVSKDQEIFAHIHPDDTHPISHDELESSTFDFEYTFPKAGTYIIAVDYANGLQLESRQFIVDVLGFPQQKQTAKSYENVGTFGGYTVTFNSSIPNAGDVATIKYEITKDGIPVTSLVPYLSAAMHIAVVKNDLTQFMHTHGEVHKPGAPIAPVLVRNGKVVHTMELMQIPPTFGPGVEAHLIFPEAGVYTVWGQFKVGNDVIPTAFTVRVQ